MSTLVLGAREGTGNIGDAIVGEMNMWDEFEPTDGHDCWLGDHYGVPRVAYHQYENLVVTVGKEATGPIRASKPEDVEEVVYANLTLPLLLVRQWTQSRMGQHGGNCVIIGSYAHDHVLTDSAVYCAAKAGLAHAVRALAWELGEDGYSFYVVHPYHVPSTPMGHRVLERMVAERDFADRAAAVAYQKKDLRLDDHLTPYGVAIVVRWLLTEDACVWLSGGGIDMYGGVR